MFITCGAVGEKEKHTERDYTIIMMVMMREYVASTSFTHVWYASSQKENFSTIWVLESEM
jgi:hypothetical protein